MAKLNLFGKSKQKDENMQVESEHKSEKPNLAEYKETLYGADSTKKELAKKKESGDQRIWRDVKSIEKNVDNLDKGKIQKPSHKLDETVDRILFKRKRK